MEFSINDITESDAQKLFASIVEFIITKSSITQRDISLTTSIGEAVISRIRNGKKKVGLKDKRYLLLLIEGFDVKIDFIDDKYQIVDFNRSIVNRKDEDLIKYKLPSIRDWKIYSYSNDKTFSIRILKIFDQDNVEFIVGTHRHNNYHGSMKWDNTNKFLIFDLKLIKSGNQDLRLIFYMGDVGAAADIMLGVLTYIRVAGDNIFSYRVIAEKITEANDLKPMKDIPLKSKEIEPSFKKYLLDKNNQRLEVPPNILTVRHLEGHLNKLPVVWNK